MVCCALVTLFIAIPLLLVHKLRLVSGPQSPLTWQLHPHSVPAPKHLSTPRTFTISGRLKSILFAYRGICHLVRHEYNARLHVGASIAATVAGLVLDISAADWRWIVLAMLSVLCAEALNTAVEEVCDLVSPEPNEQVRIAKDVAAGAVLLSATAAAAIGVLTVLPYLDLALLAHGAHHH